MKKIRFAPGTLAALLLLLSGAALLVFALDLEPASARAADDTVIRIENGDVVRTVRIDEDELERIFEDAFEDFDPEELEQALERAFSGLDGLGEEIASALEGLDIEFDADRGYGYSYRGHFDGEEFGRRMAEFGERMAEHHSRIAERVERAVERSHRRHAMHFEREARRDRRDRDAGSDDEATLRREIRELQRELDRLQRELDELDAMDEVEEDDGSGGDRN